MKDPSEGSKRRIQGSVALAGPSSRGAKKKDPVGPGDPAASRTLEVQRIQVEDPQGV